MANKFISLRIFVSMHLRINIISLCILCSLNADSKNQGKSSCAFLCKQKHSFSSIINCTDSSWSGIPFNRIGGLIVVKARVDTIEGNFVLDTGAPYLVLNITYFRDYPITAYFNDEQTSIAGRGSALQQTTVTEFALGSLHLYRIKADLVNLGKIENSKGIKLLGLLGLDLFKHCEMIIDEEKRLIYLHRIEKKEIATHRHESLSDTSLYRTFSIELANNRMTTVAEVAGKKLRLVIDCAAESNILDSRLPNIIFKNIIITGRVELTGAGEKKTEALFGNLSHIKIGSLQIDNIPVVILNLEMTCYSDGINVNGVLGSGFLLQSKFGFNFVKRKMYVWK